MSQTSPAPYSQASIGPPVHLTCPRCGAEATPAPGPQPCRQCGKPFALYPGPALDGSVVPPHPDPRWEVLRVKSAGVMTYRFGVLESIGVSEGQTDPVTGFIPIDKAGVAYADVVSLAVWRKPDWVGFVVALLVPVPLTLVMFAAAIATPGFLFGALPFAAMSAWMIYLAMGLQRNFARVVGRYRTLEIRFDRPLRRRRRFHDELLRRCGLAPGAIP